MAEKSILTKVLAAVGTAPLWFPILATIVISGARSIRDRAFRFDWLMPVELFPVAIAGGGMLTWAALQARLRRVPIGWGLGGMVGLLAGGQALAVATGLASGETEPAGWLWALVIASIVLYWLALLRTGSERVLLLRDLFHHSER